MKTNKNRTKRVVAAVVAFALIGLILLLANGFVGNPISKMIANKAAEKHLEENYSELDLDVEKAFYNFKDGNYLVKARSNTSIDTYFEMSFTPRGKLHYDSYEDAVLSKWNTRMRIEDEYRKLAESIFEDKFPYQTRIAYGGLVSKDEDFSYLQLDKIYDIKEIGKKEGLIALDIETQVQDIDTMVKALIDTKNIFDEKDLPFYSIDLTLVKAREENMEYEEGLMVKDFLYKDIYLEGLEERVEENIEATQEYWEEEENEKDKELEEFKKEEKDKDKDNK